MGSTLEAQKKKAPKLKKRTLKVLNDHLVQPTLNAIAFMGTPYPHDQARGRPGGAKFEAKSPLKDQIDVMFSQPRRSGTMKPGLDALFRHDGGMARKTRVF